MSLEHLQIPSKQITSFCRAHHIRSFVIFGSLIRHDYQPDSDIDVLVEFEPGHVPGFDFFLLEAELNRLFGCKVDLQTASFLNPEIRRIASYQAVRIYEQA